MRILLPLLGLLLASTFAAGQTSSSAPEITIRTLTLEDSSNQVSSADQKQIIDTVRRHTYRPETLDEIAQRVRDGFQQRGFFKSRSPRSPST